MAVRFGVVRETVRGRLGSYAEDMREYGPVPGREVIGISRLRPDANMAAELGITRRE